MLQNNLMRNSRKNKTSDSTYIFSTGHKKKKQISLQGIYDSMNSWNISYCIVCLYASILTFPELRKFSKRMHNRFSFRGKQKKKHFIHT